MSLKSSFQMMMVSNYYQCMEIVDLCSYESWSHVLRLYSVGGNSYGVEIKEAWKRSREGEMANGDLEGQASTYEERREHG